jgi:hypothetical protein
MPLIVPPPNVVLPALRALKTVASDGASLDPTQRKLLDVAQKHLLHSSHDLDALDPISPEELAREVGEPAIRHQLVEAMVAVTLAGVAVPRSTPALVGRFAEALGVKPDALRHLREYAADHKAILTLDFARHSFIGENQRAIFDESKIAGARAMLRIAGIGEDKALAAKYHALEKLGDDTLGHAFFDFHQRNGFSFPGEKHGAPPTVDTHDLSHVLAGYGTDIAGESQVIGFQAGYRKEGAMSFLLFLLVQFQVGVRVTYLAPEDVGYFDTPGRLEKVFKAYDRAVGMTQDLTAGWNYWSMMSMPLAEVRERFHVLPPA